MFGGQPSIPMVIRMPGGGGAQRGAQHSQFFEAMYAHVPGLKLVMPATPYDAKGMLKSAIRSNDPILFVEHELLYSVKGEVPDEGEEYTVPLDRGIVRREGKDVTLVTFSRMVHICLQAAEELAKQGIEAEVIDLRTIRPIDLDLVLDSVRKTNRVVVAEEGWKFYGTGQGIAALIYEYGFDWLDAPIGHVTGKDVPMPYSKSLEQLALPSRDEVIAAVHAIVPQPAATAAGAGAR
jgi:pyruvate dehydrogenase E1 component subunit beta